MPAPGTEPRPEPPRLLYVPEGESPRVMLARIERACEAPLGPEVAILVRAYSWSGRELFDVCRRARRATSLANARLLVSGRVDVALAAALDGVHLAAHAMDVADARALVADPRVLVGASCHDARELERARDASYVTLSPVFDVPDKLPALGLSAFASLVAASRPNVIALGGIDLASVAAVMRAGAHGIALRRAIDRSSEPALALGRFLREIDAHLAR